MKPSTSTAPRSVTISKVSPPQVGQYGGRLQLASMVAKTPLAEGDHLQPAGLDLHLVGVENPVGLGIDLAYFVAQVPAHDVHQVDGVVHDRPAAGQLRIDEPLAVFGGQLALVGGVEAVHLDPGRRPPGGLSLPAAAG